MEQANILDWVTPSEEVGFAPSATDCGLNMALVYQDTPTWKWAAQVQKQLLEVAGNDGVHCTRWKISRLGNPEVFWDAVMMAVAADVIVVSIYDTEELPIEFRTWVGAWVARRVSPAGTLIALIGTNGKMRAGTMPAVDYLGAVACKGRLNFQLRERGLSPRANPRPASFRPVRKVTALQLPHWRGRGRVW